MNFKKSIISFLTAGMLVFASSANAENWAIGMSIYDASVDTTGTESTKGAGDAADSTSHSKDVTIPEFFVEYQYDNGAALGLTFIPEAEMGAKSRTDTAGATAGGGAENDTGTFTAKASIKSHVMMYLDYPVFSAYNQSLFVKLGGSVTTVDTEETLASGTNYGDDQVLGYAYGAGVKGDVWGTENVFYKAEYVHHKFDDLKFEANGSPQTITADSEVDKLGISIGARF